MKNLPPTGGVGDLQHFGGGSAGVQGSNGGPAHGLGGGLAISTGGGQLGRVERQVGRQVLGQDLSGALGVGSADPDLDIEASGA